MKKEDVRIVFLGTPQLAAEGLKTLIKNGFNIVGVVSQPDSASKNHSNILIPSPVSKVAIENNIPLHRPIKLNKDYEFIANLNPDILLTYAFGQILSTNVLNLSINYPPLNVHASDLPKLRGASPIQSALLEGMDYTAVDLMEMVKEMDAGRVFYSKKIKIEKNDNCTSLTEKVSKTAKEVLLEGLPLYLENQLIGVEQDASLATFCHTFSSADYILKPSFDGNKCINIIRAFSMKPGAYIQLDNGEKIKIFSAEFEESNDNISPGSIIVNKKGIKLRFFDGYIIPNQLQKDGKRMMDSKAFANGAQSLCNHKFIEWYKSI